MLKHFRAILLSLGGAKALTMGVQGVLPEDGAIAFNP